MKTDRLYVNHIIECIEKIEEMSEAGEESFLQDYKIRDAILRNLQVMAESMQKLSSEFKDNVAQINWRTLSSFRNILVHNYIGLDMKLVW